MQHRQTYYLKIAYDGTSFVGWQVQPNGPSIQSLLQEKLSILLKENIVVIGSGRTDSGVHASGQVAHFHTDQKGAEKHLYGLNALLPDTVRVLELKPVSPQFHARFSAKRKTYHYHLALGGVVSPFLYAYRTYVRAKLNLELLAEAARLLVGTHNFSAFANEAGKGSAAVKPVKTLYRVDVKQEEGGIRIEFEGDGFLYKMVRNMVGQLLFIAKGKAPVSSITELLNGGSRVECAAAALPQGLFLFDVVYPEELMKRPEMENTSFLETDDLGVDDV